MFLVKTDSDGTELWSKWYGERGPDYGQCFVANSDGCFAIAGISYSTGTHSSADVFLLKTGAGNGLVCVEYTANNVTLFRGESYQYWNYVRIRIWKID